MLDGRTANARSSAYVCVCVCASRICWAARVNGRFSILVTYPENVYSLNSLLFRQTLNLKIVRCEVGFLPATPSCCLSP